MNPGDSGQHKPDLTQAKLGSDQQIAGLRNEVDLINRKIVELMAERFELTRRIGRIKADLGIQVEDLERERRMFSDLKKTANDLGLDPGVVQAIFETIAQQTKRENQKYQ